MTYKSKHGSSKISNLLLAVLSDKDVIRKHLPLSGEIAEFQQLDVTVVGLEVLIYHGISDCHSDLVFTIQAKMHQDVRAP